MSRCIRTATWRSQPPVRRNGTARLHVSACRTTKMKKSQHTDVAAYAVLIHVDRTDSSFRPLDCGNLMREAEHELALIYHLIWCPRVSKGTVLFGSVGNSRRWLEFGGPMRVHRLALHGANAYVISGEHHVLVDTGPARARTALLEGLAQIGIGGQDLALVLVTHAHASSAGNAAYLQRVFHVPVAVHGADAPILASGVDRKAGRGGVLRALGRSLVETRFDALAPDVVFGRTLSLDPFGCQGTVVHAPGHTIGSSSVLLDTGDAIVGDLVTGGWFGGRVMPNRPTRPGVAELPGRVARSLALLARLGAQRLHPGTGGELRMSDVKRLVIDRATSIALGPTPTRVRERRLRAEPLTELALMEHG